MAGTEKKLFSTFNSVAAVAAVVEVGAGVALALTTAEPLAAVAGILLVADGIKHAGETAQRVYDHYHP